MLSMLNLPREARILDNGLKLGKLLRHLLHLVELLLVLDHHDVAPRVLGHVPAHHRAHALATCVPSLPGGVRAVGGVDPGCQAPGHHPGHGADVPLGGVEAKDVDGVERLEAELDKSFGHRLDLLQVLGVGPLNPLVIPLHSHGDTIGISFHCVIQHRPHLKIVLVSRNRKKFNSNAVTYITWQMFTHRYWLLLAQGVLVRKPDLHGAVGPGGAQTVGGQDPVRPDPVAPAALGHQPVPAVLQGGGAQGVAVQQRRPPAPFHQNVAQPCSRHHVWRMEEPRSLLVLCLYRSAVTLCNEGSSSYVCTQGFQLYPTRHTRHTATRSAV